ncbi:MAG: DNA-binding protein [Burkholderiaceae bacterium]|jgi:gp16 family phage-associated protein|nr:DNA-binding protein [Burkholderiaceae bacterium]
MKKPIKIDLSPLPDDESPGTATSGTLAGDNNREDLPSAKLSPSLKGLLERKRRAVKLEQVRQEFSRKGMTFIEWSEKHHFKYTDVIAVINGKTIGRRGKAHHIAIALGLKEGTPE